MLTFLFACGATVPSIENAPELPADLVVEVVLPVSDGVLALGRLAGPPTEPVASRRLGGVAILGGRSIPAFRDEPGWIIAADARDGEVWVVRAVGRADKSGSDYDLRVSEDGGRTWAPRGAVPAGSLTHVEIAGGGRGWVMGAGVLLRTDDGGASWVSADAPGRRRGWVDDIGASDRDHLVIGGPFPQATADGGLGWTRIGDLEVTATDGRFVAALDGGVRVGRVDGAAIRWAGLHPGAWRADALTSRGDEVWVRAAALDAARAPIVLHSTDGGATFAVLSTRGATATASVGLGRDGAVWQVDVRRNLRRLR